MRGWYREHADSINATPQRRSLPLQIIPNNCLPPLPRLVQRRVSKLHGEGGWRKHNESGVMEVQRLRTLEREWAAIQTAEEEGRGEGGELNGVEYIICPHADWVMSAVSACEVGIALWGQYDSD